jgi:hypothetical protein
MTPAIPTNAGRVEPVYGWAAFHPGGMPEPFIHSGAVRSYAREVRDYIGEAWRRHSGETHAQGWRRAYRAGWRVIRVQISPAGEGEERS